MSSTARAIQTRLPRLAEAAVERARLTVVPRGRTRAAKVPFVTLLSLLMLGGVVGLLLFNTSMQQSAFAATELQDRATVLTARQASLSMQLERLRDPQNVARRAQAQGLVLPAAPQFLDLSDGTVTGTTDAALAPGTLALDPPPAPLPAELRPPAPTQAPPEGTLPGDRDRSGDRDGSGDGDRSGDRDGSGGREGSDAGDRSGDRSGDRDGSGPERQQDQTGDDTGEDAPRGNRDGDAGGGRNVQ